MLNADYVEPPICHFCNTEHEDEYPHEFTATFKFRFFNKHKRQATIKDTYSHCKGLIFECAEIVHEKELDYGDRPASGGGMNNTGSKGFVPQVILSE